MTLILGFLSGQQYLIRTAPFGWVKHKMLLIPLLNNDLWRKFMTFPQEWSCRVYVTSSSKALSILWHFYILRAQKMTRTQIHLPTIHPTTCSSGHINQFQGTLSHQAEKIDTLTTSHTLTVSSRQIKLACKVTKNNVLKSASHYSGNRRMPNA